MQTYTFNKKFLAGDVYWVTSPLLKESQDPRKHVTHLLIKDGKLTATDGSRLHHVDLDGFGTDGLYRVLKRTKSEIVIQQIDEEFNYPDFEDLLTITPGSTAVECPISDTGEYSSAYALILRKMEANTLQYKFVADILSIDDCFTAHVNEDGNKPVHFENGNKIAIVMPKRI